MTLIMNSEPADTRQSRTVGRDLIGIGAITAVAVVGYLLFPIIWRF
jgi:branched-chain amino acid transport system permease protein